MKKRAGLAITKKTHPGVRRKLPITVKSTRKAKRKAGPPPKPKSAQLPPAREAASFLGDAATASAPLSVTVPPSAPAADIVPKENVPPTDPSVPPGGLAKSFFQDSTEYYLAALEKYRCRRFAGWNFAAFFMGPFWFFYRRVPYYGWIALGISSLSLLPQLRGLAFCMSFFWGFLGNEIYFSYLKKKHRGVSAETQDSAELQTRLARAGGV